MSNSNSNLIKNDRSVKENKLNKLFPVVVSIFVIGVMTLIFCCNPSLAVKGYNKIVGRDAYKLVDNDTGKKKVEKVDYKPEDIVKEIGDYNIKSLKLENEYVVTDKEIETYMDYELENYNTTVDIPDGNEVPDGATVIVTYTGKIDGKDFEGSAGTEEEIVLGSGTYLKDFESGIVGHTVGSTFDINVKFPDDYTEESLKGKEAVFNVTIVSAKFVTEYNHDNVTDEIIAANNSDYSTVEEFREYCKNYMVDYYNDLLENDKKQAVLDAILEVSEYDIPDNVLQQEIDIYEQQFKNLYCLETTLESFLDENYGITVEEFREEITEDVTKSFTNVVVCQRLAQIKNFELTDDAFKKYIEELVEGSSYGTDELEELYKVYTTDYMDGETYVKRMALCDAVISDLMEDATFVVNRTELNEKKSTSTEEVE